MVLWARLTVGPVFLKEQRELVYFSNNNTGTVSVKPHRYYYLLLNEFVCVTVCLSVEVTVCCLRSTSETVPFSVNFIFYCPKVASVVPGSATRSVTALSFDTLSDLMVAAYTTTPIRAPLSTRAIRLLRLILRCRVKVI